MPPVMPTMRPTKSGIFDFVVVNGISSTVVDCAEGTTVLSP